MTSYRKLLKIIVLIFIYSIGLSQPSLDYKLELHVDYKLPETFIYATASPSYFQNIPAPPDCLNIGENYSEILTGYETYKPCIPLGEQHTPTYHTALGSIIDIYAQNHIPSIETKSFTSKNMRGIQPYVEHKTTSNFIDFSKQYSGLQRLVLVNHKVDSLKGLETLEHLKYLELSVTFVRDWSSISQLPHIETLNLACSNITDDDLQYIAQLSTVKTLILDGTEISDLSALSNMTNLQNLLIKVTNINKLEELDILKPLNLRWISFDSRFSRQVIIEKHPHLDLSRFMQAHPIETVGFRFIDSYYPSKNCSEWGYNSYKVW